MTKRTDRPITWLFDRRVRHPLKVQYCSFFVINLYVRAVDWHTIAGAIGHDQWFSKSAAWSACEQVLNGIKDGNAKSAMLKHFFPVENKLRLSIQICETWQKDVLMICGSKDLTTMLVAGQVFHVYLYMSVMSSYCLHSLESCIWSPTIVDLILYDVMRFQ